MAYNYSIRKSCPNGNKEYITRGAGGYSTCIVGSPTKSGANTLANCVGYACGRFNEIYNKITGNASNKYASLNCNAENFIERAISLGLKVVSDPTPGGIMVFQKGATLSGGDGAGHVMAVEEVYSRDDVYTSESGWGSNTPFWNSRRKRNSNNWGMGSAYKYRGCIVNPAVKEITPPTPEPTPTPSGDFDTYVIKPGDTLSGIAARYGTTYQYLAEINGIADPNKINAGATIKVPKGNVPTPTPAPAPSGLNIGDAVEIIGRGNGNSYGTANSAGGLGWTRYITAIYSGRKYPYQVGNKGRTDSANTTGFYQASALRKK